MFHKICCTLLLLFLFIPSNAQQLELKWTAEYPNVSNHFSGFLDQRLLVDDDKNVMVCRGNINQSNSILVLNYDSLGQFQWKVEYDEPYGDFLSGCVLFDAGLIIGGTSFLEPNGAAQAIVNSYDVNGQERYLNTIYEPMDYSADLNALKQDSAGYLYAFGSTCKLPCNPDNSESLYYIAKVDPFTGDVIWEKHERLGRASKAQIIGDRMRVLGVVAMPDSNYVLSLFDFDLDGNVLDSLLLFDWTGASSVLLDNDGHMVVVDDEICSYNMSKDTSWCYDYLEGNPNLIGEVRKILADEDNNLYVTGWIRDNANAISFTKTVKIAPDGAVLWDSKSHYSDSVSYEEGLTISVSDKYIFVGSNAYFGPDNSLTADFRPILYSREDGQVLSDTLISFSTNETLSHSVWDGEHFYLYGTYYSGGEPDTSHTAVLFKFGIDEPVPAQEQNIIQKISTYPNPFQNTFDLSIKTTQSGTAQMAVFNTIGQKVLEQETTLVSGANKVSIETTNGWAAGVYFISVEMNGQVYFEKVVKGE